MTSSSTSDTGGVSDAADDERSTAMRDADLANGEGDPDGDGADAGADGATSAAGSHPTGEAQAAQNREEDPPA